MLKRIFAVPVLDGMEVKYNTTFNVDGDKAEITFFVANEEVEAFVSDVFAKPRHTLSFKFAGDGVDSLTFPLYDDCEVSVKGLHSDAESVTEITYLVTKIAA